ncbi:hypothetical protein [Lactobacillus ultunensis]|uniref:Macrophage migration inhibitory factor (MIF) n=1 Tax=Lactobacillus ultunensis DSM 16047 TaxID=525365 RepID=C2END6_9LACO|nr:hypothetical protein [Lactobacillus ultunensis]EEJ71940.1 hypothetical protein HMPREF0548_1182 [Lactobacillus ultunensis DSM 16047]KRL82063.1 hypothetical protein FC57_GL000149 [Lactobacillus ultunensis DSM 16047]QQP27650.1 hypothetical protein H4B44_05805 [Lactobacillus ultunensis]
MPFITVRANQKITKEQEIEIKKELGKAIAFVPGKSEQSLMVMFEPNTSMYLRGEDSQKMAFLDVAVFGNESHKGYPEFSLYMSKSINEILNVKPENIFIDYRDIPVFGASGYAFAR